MTYPYPIGGTGHQTLGKYEMSATYSNTQRDKTFFFYINYLANV